MGESEESEKVKKVGKWGSERSERSERSEEREGWEKVGEGEKKIGLFIWHIQLIMI